MRPLEAGIWFREQKLSACDVAFRLENILGCVATWHRALRAGSTAGKLDSATSDITCRHTGDWHERWPRCCDWWWSCGGNITRHLRATVLCTRRGPRLFVDRHGSTGQGVLSSMRRQHRHWIGLVIGVIIGSPIYVRCIPFLSCERASRTAIDISMGVRPVLPDLRWAWKSGLEMTKSRYL